ncbi:hypothetical protein MWU54_17440 [Marivita sp. S6314]|uniref:MotE family protein n=1 Tax=Marivita sp. S6314 TaxID=2926406 RepID=UPI001FF2AECE|nr:hypothetical protein [Marivita sp. S6314]MCK0151831.1 hypothetical protein [Marivita sp. S6314]
MIGTLLLLSAGLRIATDASAVIASEGLETSKHNLAELSPNTDLARPQDMEVVLEALKDRETQVSEREEQMALREKEIEQAERAIEAELEKLEQAEENLRRTITLASEAAEKDVAQLTSVYSDMKPKQAAALFEQMDPGFAAGFLARMPSDSAARIMAGMSPEQAYIVSIELAGRNADIPME